MAAEVLADVDGTSVVPRVLPKRTLVEVEGNTTNIVAERCPRPAIGRVVLVQHVWVVRARKETQRRAMLSMSSSVFSASLNLLKPVLLFNRLATTFDSPMTCQATRPNIHVHIWMSSTQPSRRAAIVQSRRRRPFCVPLRAVWWHWRTDDAHRWFG